MVQRLSVWQGLAVAGLCALVFSPALTGQFLLWDDQHHIVRNPWLIEGDWLHFWRFPYYGFFIPVSYTLWTWIYSVLPQPQTFHVFNLLLHILNCLLVARVLPALFRELDRKSVFLAVLIFALHPLQTETVAWISGGRDLLAAFFALIACFLVFEKAGRWTLVFAASFFFLSLLSKPQYLALPLALAWLSREHRRTFASWIVLSLAVAIGTSIIQNEFVATRLEQVPFWMRPLIAFDALGFYARKLVWPWPLNADYGRTPTLVLREHAYLGSIVVLAGFAAAVTAAYGFKRDFKNARGLVFAALVLLPVLGLISFSGQEQSTVYDRYMYLPMIGAAAFLVRITDSPVGRPILNLAVVGWAVMSFNQGFVWQNDRTLSERMIELNPKSYSALNNLAATEIKAGAFAIAAEHLRAARNLKPKVAVAISNLAHAYWEMKDLERIFIEIEPLLNDNEFISFNTTESEGLALMYRMVGRAHYTLQHKEDARDCFCKARKMSPADTHLKNETEAVLKELGEKCP